MNIEETVARYQRLGESEDLEKVVRQMERTVRGIARHYDSHFCESQDLVQTGYVGLLKAVEKFDALRGVKFSTFASRFIAGEIKHSLRDDGLVRLARNGKPCPQFYPITDRIDLGLVDFGYGEAEVWFDILRATASQSRKQRLALLYHLYGDSQDLAGRRAGYSAHSQKYVSRLRTRLAEKLGPDYCVAV